jgi:hypothetical protein
MRSIAALRASALLLLVATLITSCGVSTTGTSDSKASQCRIDTDVLCPGNFVGYSCQGDAKPPGSCSDGTLEFDGEIGYCCAVQD